MNLIEQFEYNHDDGDEGTEQNGNSEQCNNTS